MKPFLPIRSSRCSGRARIAAAALLGLALCGACTADDEAASQVALPEFGAYSLALVGDLYSAHPAPPAPASEVDPFDPWASLGPLTGGYALSVERLDHDCSFGPDVPLSRHYSDYSGLVTTVWETSQDFRLSVVQRGDAIVFELGEGVVRAVWNQIDGTLEHVERIGAEGTTHYVDGFDVQLTGTGFVIEGESDWLFDDEFYAPRESCSGRTRWRAEQISRPPSSRPNDFQVVLRWPSSSDADLDLMLRPPHASEDERADLVGVEGGCRALRSTGHAASSRASVWDDLIADASETTLPYHEEVIRCSAAAYGEWRFAVMNWSRSESVAFEIEAFWGPGVNTTWLTDRSFGALSKSVSPRRLKTISFQLDPPDTPGSTAGAILMLVGGETRLVAEREPGPWTGTLLEFRKAALEGLSYDEFVDALSTGP